MTEPDAHVHRIQALLDKAESTTFPEEAEALLAKAQELMARHAIDEALLAAAHHRDDAPTSRQIVVAAPYASAKVALLSAVARANRCRVVVGRGPSGAQYATVVGFPADLDHTATLFSSLSIQAVRFMLAAPVPPTDTPRRFRHAFLLAYGHRVGERLEEADQSAAAEAQAAQMAAPGGPSVSLLLASRAHQVDQEFRRMFPRLRYRSVSLSSSAGVASGRRAADRSQLGGRPLPTQRGLGSG